MLVPSVGEVEWHRRSFNFLSTRLDRGRSCQVSSLLSSAAQPPSSRRGSIFSATYKWGQDGRRAAELRLPAAISTSPFLPSLPTQLCSSSFPSFISVQTKAPKWLECLRQMDALSFLGSPSNNSKCLNRRDAVSASENRAARRG